ncbi:MAG TPA: hypothetical protein VF551_09395, partial [Chthoniobacterales bacterium]
MSEESDYQQQPVETKPASTRRRRPSRRGSRGRKADGAKGERNDSTATGSKNRHAGDDGAVIESQDAPREAAERMTSADGEARISSSDSSTDQAPKVAASSLGEKMDLGNPENTTTLAPEDAHSSAPQNERGFRDRDRNRDRDRDRSQGGGYSNGDQVVELEPGEGIIEISGKGFGFLRDAKRNFVQTPQDIFVTPEIVRRFALRDGMWVQGETRR